MIINPYKEVISIMFELNKSDYVKQWLADKGFHFQPQLFERENVIRCLYLCINFIEQDDSSSKNYLVDENDELQSLYGKNNFEGKIGIKPVSKFDIIKKIIMSLIGTTDLCDGLINAISIFSTSFLANIVILPNDEQRCVYLILAILSNGSYKWIGFDEITRYVTTNEDTNICPFKNIFDCCRINAENNTLCANNIFLKSTLKKLHELGIVDVNFELNTAKLREIIE